MSAKSPPRGQWSLYSVVKAIEIGKGTEMAEGYSRHDDGNGKRHNDDNNATSCLNRWRLHVIDWP